MSNKIIKDGRNSSPANLTIKEIILNDLLYESEKQYYYTKEGVPFSECSMDLFMDKKEISGMFTFKLEINGEPAGNKCSSFFALLVPGRQNDKGVNEVRFDCSVDHTTERTLVTLHVISPNIDQFFSDHKDGYSYANYSLFGVVSTDNSNLLVARGKIYRSDVVGDAVEGRIK